MYVESGEEEKWQRCDDRRILPAPESVPSRSTRSVLQIDSTTGPYYIIYGWAEASDPSQPAALTVNLQGVPFPAPYWIVLLGPTINNQYDWAVVSDEFAISLFVLARNVTEFQTNYEASVLNRLNGLGFNQFYNTPIPIPQTDCTYLPQPDFAEIARRFP
jgi:Lipocalin-like domain